VKVSEQNTQNFSKVEKSIVLAFERVGLMPEHISNISNDLKSAFPTAKDEIIIEVIKEGALGAYGRTYRMSSQEICIWVRGYLKIRNKYIDANGDLQNKLAY